MIRLIVIISILFSALSALSLDELKRMPKSIERDFYIWQYIEDKKTTPKEAKEAIKLRKSTNYLLKKSYKKKTGIKLTSKRRARKKPNTAYLKRKQEVIKALKKYGDFFTNWKTLPPKERLTIFNLAGKQNRRVLNQEIDANFYNQISKYYAINQFIYRAKKEHLANLLKTIYNTPPAEGNKINYKNLMDLGFKDLTSKNKNATAFFVEASKKARDRFNADRALFWSYMASKDKKYLTKLAKTYDFNIYKLIALDLLNKPYPMPAKLPTTNNTNIQDLKSPIEWAKLKKKIFSKHTNLYALAQQYANSKTLGLYSYILTKASRHTKQYFPLAYKEHMANLPVKRQAMLLAIARQESRFVPVAVSRSFAVGLMQFMPFLVKDIAKKRKENIELNDMFKPEVAIRFANTHLDYLDKWLFNPLFVAYAYNAGIGYTRKMVRKNHMFRAGEFEPYLSIERLDNPEANKYGRMVLANYVIYRMLLGSPVKITDILKDLTNPKLTDRFRK